MTHFKPHYGPGEAVLAQVDYHTTPLRLFRAGLMAEGVSVALFAARTHNDMVATDSYFKSLMGFITGCVRKWEFQASIADRFTRPGAVFH